MAQTRVELVTGRVSEPQVVTLAGNLSPLIRTALDEGAVAPAERMERMLLVLAPSPAQQAALDALLAAQQDPRSALYHRWLTPAEYGAQFGASAADRTRVAGWLAAQGFTVEEMPAGNSLIVFSGTAGQVDETFHAAMRRYRVAGAVHLANAQDPQIPASLAGVVAGVVSLHGFPRQSYLHSRTALDAQPQYSAGGTHYMFPADFAAIYDLNPLFGAGITGAGSAIAIAARSNISVSDVVSFRSLAGLPASTPSVILAGADPGLVKGDQDEATLDVEWSGAAAPGASIRLVTAASTATTDGIDLAAAFAVNHATAPVLAVSYGSCEQEMGAAERAFYNQLWEQAASQGMSVLVASGDAGAAGCSAASGSSGSGAAINGLCSSPYVTCVGGTALNEGGNEAQYWAASNAAGYASALGYIPETVWNESGANGGAGLWASGGGASMTVAQPEWQALMAGAGAANGMRAVPDVALAAAKHDGSLVAENGSFWIVSGTSVSTPAFAGILALVGSQQGGQGNANPELYALARSASSPFHATQAGNNSVPGVTGFAAAGTAYNLATGLGSVDAARLLEQWGTGAGPDFALQASAASGSVPAGGTASFTLGVSQRAGAANLVHLAAAGPEDVTVAFSSLEVAPGTPVTVTVSVALTAAAGSQTITLTGWDDSGTATLNYALTVTVPPALMLRRRSNGCLLRMRAGCAPLAPASEIAAPARR